jgi:HNH endonuclease
MPKIEIIRKLPSAEYLRECFDYDPETGELRWKRRPREHFPTTNSWAVNNARQAGKAAGSLTYKGYCSVMIAGHSYSSHRIIWKLMTNEEPPPMLDHINGIRTDNRWHNLRAANWWEQAHNRRLPKTNISGYRGVSQKGEKWQARIGFNNVMRHLGTFATAEEASRAYEAAAFELHGEFYKPQ